MKEFMIIFQIGDVSYLVGNNFYSATVKKAVKEKESVHYEVRLHDEVLISKFGIHHDYYLTEDGKVNFTIGGVGDIMDLHRPILTAIDKEFAAS